LFHGYVINNKLIDPESSLFKNIFKSYGLKNNFLKLVEQRIENNKSSLIKDLNKNEWEQFLILSYEVIPYKSGVYRRKSLNIFMLDIITTYRG
jgi:hypothetical protein